MGNKMGGAYQRTSPSQIHQATRSPVNSFSTRDRITHAISGADSPSKRPIK